MTFDDIVQQVRETDVRKREELFRLATLLRGESKSWIAEATPEGLALIVDRLSHHIANLVPRCGLVSDDAFAICDHEALRMATNGAYNVAVRLLARVRDQAVMPAAASYDEALWTDRRVAGYFVSPTIRASEKLATILGVCDHLEAVVFARMLHDHLYDEPVGVAVSDGPAPRAYKSLTGTGFTLRLAWEECPLALGWLPPDFWDELRQRRASLEQLSTFALLTRAPDQPAVFIAPCRVLDLAVIDVLLALHAVIVKDDKDAVAHLNAEIEAFDALLTEDRPGVLDDRDAIRLSSISSFTAPRRGRRAWPASVPECERLVQRLWLEHAPRLQAPGVGYQLVDGVVYFGGLSRYVVPDVVRARLSPDADEEALFERWIEAVTQPGSQSFFQAPRDWIETVKKARRDLTLLRRLQAVQATAVEIFAAGAGAVSSTAFVTLMEPTLLPEAKTFAAGMTAAAMNALAGMYRRRRPRP